jgi:hypothetical protein
MNIRYFSGVVPKDDRIRADMERDPRFGFLLTPNMHNRAPEGAWGADTGCFTAAGGDNFSPEKYFAWLKSRPVSTSLFATGPDVLGEPGLTIARSLPVLPAIRALGYKAALVAQDGLEKLEVPWSKFDCLFLGGRPKEDPADEWKLSLAAAELVHEAKARGLWVHMGRVNSYRRLKYAASIGCDSADGTFLKFAVTENYGRMCRWFDKLGAPGPEPLRAAA